MLEVRHRPRPAQAGLFAFNPPVGVDMPRKGQAETKSLQFDEIAFDEMDGIIEGIAAVTGNVDRVGDRFVAGAFGKTIADHKSNFMKIPMALDHEVGFGVTLEMEEVGRSDLPAAIRSVSPDATGGLYCKGQVVMMPENVARLDALRERKSAGSPPGMSVTYWSIREQKSMVGGKSVRDIGEAAIGEWGPTVRKTAINPLAYITGVKSMDAAAAASPDRKADIAGSFEALRTAVDDAIREAGLFSGEDRWTWIQATTPDHVIVNVSAQDEATRTYRVDYAQVSGQIILGAVTEVELQLTVAEKATAEMGLLDFVNRTTAEMKAGKVLSQRNLEELDAAIAALTRIRAAAGGTDTEGSAGSGESTVGSEGKAGDAPAGASAEDGEAADAPPDGSVDGPITWDLKALDADLAILGTRVALATIGR